MLPLLIVAAVIGIGLAFQEEKPPTITPENPPQDDKPPVDDPPV